MSDEIRFKIVYSPGRVVNAASHVYLVYGSDSSES